MWRKAHELVLAVYSFTAAFPKQETYGLALQMRRAAVSVPANIAEGFRRRGQADKARYMNMAEVTICRLRWQIELVFKRMKSIMGMGHLPKADPNSSRAWLHGKLFVALLVERMIEAAKSFFPWGYPLEVSP